MSRYLGIVRQRLESRPDRYYVPAVSFSAGMCFDIRFIEVETALGASDLVGLLALDLGV